jgi:hypothetical protein
MIKRISPSMAVSLTALLISLGGAGYSATGGNFILGRTNSATTTTSLNSNINARALTLINQNTGTSASALQLAVAPGRPPLIVNSTARVRNLNADFVDGFHASDFARSSSEGWHYVGDPGEPPFLNGWSNFDPNSSHRVAAHQHVAFRIDANGTVHIRGLAKGGTLNQPIFQLPSAYCPHYDKVFPVIANNAFARITVNALYRHFAAQRCTVFQNIGSTNWVSLEGVSFPKLELDQQDANAPT